VADEDEVESRHIHLANLSAVDAVGDDREALAQIRILADPAGTVDIAGARFDERPVQ
jgi:hypothetical protein